MILAHAGHWLVNLLYAAPLLAVIAIIVRDRMRQRRDEEAGEREALQGVPEADVPRSD